MFSMGSFDSDEIKEVGLESMMVLTGKTSSSATPAQQEANSKYPASPPVPQPQSRVAREKGEEMQLSTTELVSESERLRRQNQELTSQLGHVTSRGQSCAIKAKQQDELALIAHYKEQLRVSTVRDSGLDYDKIFCLIVDEGTLALRICGHVNFSLISVPMHAASHRLQNQKGLPHKVLQYSS